MITPITPVVEVDGRDRMVDLYKWHLAHQDFYPPLIYWGKYVRTTTSRRHGRDAQTHRKRSHAYIDWKAQVLPTCT